MPKTDGKAAAKATETKKKKTAAATTKAPAKATKTTTTAKKATKSTSKPATAATKKPAATKVSKASATKATKTKTTTKASKPAVKVSATKKTTTKATAAKSTKATAKPVKKSTTVKPAAKKETNATTASTTRKKSADVIKAEYFDCFVGKDYLSLWKRFAKEGNAGIILTNTSGSSDADALLSELRSYCAARVPFARYTVLDLKNFSGKNFADCASVVKLLNEIYAAAVPCYLMIVGDSGVIPFMNWENCSGDDDATVPSDLPYITLDTASPWNGQSYSFVGATKVGRIPASPINGFENAIKYFRFAAGYKHQPKVKPFAITAYEWTKASDLVFSKLKCPVISSPDYTCNSRYILTSGMTRTPDVSDRNLLGFNLHGSDATHDWYGQKGNVYPEAFNTACLPKSQSGYTICVEACYGARPKVERGKDQSIVVSALSDKCVAFVGSTRIAYGAVGSSMSCADVIANTFLKSVIDSKTSGEAFLDSLTALLKSGYNENIIKTLAEFALYGDPSIIPFGDGKTITVSSMETNTKKVKTKANANKAIKLVPCDTVTTKSAEWLFGRRSKVDKEEAALHNVTESSNNFISKFFSSLFKKGPKIFRVADTDEYRTIYTSKKGKVVTYVKLHINGKGKVLQTYISK